MVRYLNTKLTIELFDELIKYRKTTKLLSQDKLNTLLNDYKEYQNNNVIKEERIDKMNKDELLKLNN